MARAIQTHEAWHWHSQLVSRLHLPPSPVPPCLEFQFTALQTLVLHNFTSYNLAALQTLVSTAHSDLVAQINSMPATATTTQTAGLATSIQQLDYKLDSHIDSLQRYHHQLYQALHADIHKLSINFQEFSRTEKHHPPPALMTSIASLADQTLQLYNN